MTPFCVVDETTTQTISQHGYSIYLYRNTPNTVLVLSNHVYIYNLYDKSFRIAKEDKKSLLFGEPFRPLPVRKGILICLTPDGFM